MKHSDRPVEDELTPEFADSAGDILQSEYARYLRVMEKEVVGKTVAGSEAGTSGFLLVFSDQSWVVTYLESDRLAYQMGDGVPGGEIKDLLWSSEYGDASETLPADLPYAEERCVMSEEVAKCHGLPVVGLAYGSDCFSFRFPKGWEVDAVVLQDGEGRIALRVFWEQW